MLSPSMITSSNGNVACSFVIWLATSYCSLSRVPFEIVAEQAFSLFRFPAQEQRRAERLAHRIEEHRRLVVRNTVGRRHSAGPQPDRVGPGPAGPCNAGIEHRGGKRQDVLRALETRSAEKRFVWDLRGGVGQRGPLFRCFV